MGTSCRAQAAWLTLTLTLTLTLCLLGHVVPGPGGVEAACAVEGGLERLGGSGCGPARQLRAELCCEALGLAPHAAILLDLGLEDLGRVVRLVGILVTWCLVGRK